MARLAHERRSARTASIGDLEQVFFGGCGYLGLGHHPAVLRAFRRGLESYGINVGASIATTGRTRAHEDLEHELARFLGVEAVLLTASGYLANLVVAQGLLARAPSGERAWVLLEERAHSSLVDALQAVRIGVLRYGHLDPRSAFEQAGEAENRELALCSDAVFPAERAAAPIPELLTALGMGIGTLWLDDCHGFGVLGPRGRGTLEHFGIADPRVALVGTLSKALGCQGGFVAGREDLIELLRRESAAYAGASPLLPAAAVAASAALQVLDDEPERLARLRANEARVRVCLRELGLPLGRLDFPVFAFGADRPEGRERLEHALTERGLHVPWIHYADRRAGYYRIALCSEHTERDIELLCDALRRELSAVQPIALSSRP